MGMVICIVEGHGEVKTLPVLVRRIAQDLGCYVEVPAATRSTKGKIKTELGRLLALAHLELKSANQSGAVLVVLDADDECPAELGQQLKATAEQLRPDILTVIAVANREFEAWYLAGIESLGGKQGLPNNLTKPSDPEAIRNAKGWLGEHMGSYSPTIHQEKLAAVLNFEQARSSKSFARFHDRVKTMILTLMQITDRQKL